MPDNITYPEGSYGIMTNDALNKYLRFTNQRKAATGIAPSTADTQAFWSGTMDSVVKSSSARAMQNLENRRLNATIDYQNKQLDMADNTRKSQMVSGLAQYPMTYLMYDALGIGRGKGTQSSMGKLWDSAGENLFNPIKKKIFGDSVTNNSPLQFAGDQPSRYSGQGIEGSGDVIDMGTSPGGGYSEYFPSSFSDPDLFSYEDALSSSGMGALGASAVDSFGNAIDYGGSAMDSDMFSDSFFDWVMDFL